MSNKRYDTVVSPEDRKRILEEVQGGVCGFCGAPLGLEGSEAHHCIPIGQGGPNTEGNVLVVHSSPCHEILDEFAGKQVYFTQSFGMFDVIMGGKSIEEAVSSIQIGAEFTADSFPGDATRLDAIRAKSTDRLNNPQQVEAILNLAIKKHEKELYELGVEYGKNLVASLRNKE